MTATECAPCTDLTRGAQGRQTAARACGLQLDLLLDPAKFMLTDECTYITGSTLCSQRAANTPRQFTLFDSLSVC